MTRTRWTLLGVAVLVILVILFGPALGGYHRCTPGDYLFGARHLLHWSEASDHERHATRAPALPSSYPNQRAHPPRGGVSQAA